MHLACPCYLRVPYALHVLHVLHALHGLRTLDALRSGLLAFHTLCTLRALSGLSLFVIFFTLKETTLRFLDRSIENRTKIKRRRKTLIYFLLKLTNNYFCMIC